MQNRPQLSLTGADAQLDSPTAQCFGRSTPPRRGGTRVNVRALVAAFAKMAVSLGLVAYLLSRYAIDRRMLGHIDPTWCAVAFAALAATLPVASERWRVILLHFGGRAARSTVFRIFTTSAFFSQVLPSVGGDLVRILYHRMLDSTAGLLAVSVVLDRGMGVMGLLVLALGAYPLLSAWSGSDVITVPVETLAVGSLLGAGFGALLLPALRRVALWRRVPVALRTTLDGIAWAVASRDGLLRLLPLSVPVHLLSIVAVYAIARSLGINLSLRAAAGASPVILLAQVLPISIGGWGVRETAAVTLLATMGVDPASALALSIIFGTLFALASLPGLLCWFTLRE